MRIQYTNNPVNSSKNYSFFLHFIPFFLQPENRIKKEGAVAKTALRGRHLFEKRLSSPQFIFQKLLRGIAFIVADKKQFQNF